MNRVLIVDKPRGITSHDVVARVRRSTRVKKVGHAGTLDPGATGVLVVLVGKATRLAQFFVDCGKAYRGRVVLGVRTDSQDADGKVVETRDVGDIPLEKIEAAFAKFEGEIAQTPPMVSALKHEGTRLYTLARKGVEVDRRARNVVVNSFRVLSVELPEVEFEVDCSRGTYVRTLAADVGEELGCGGHLGDLVRTRVGDFSIEQSLRLEEVEALGQDLTSAGLSMFQSLAMFPALTLNPAEEDTISTGGAIEAEPGRIEGAPADFIRLTSDGVDLVAVAKTTAAGPEDRGDGASVVTIRPVRVFIEPY